MPRPTIALALICKNETAVIRDCLESVKPVIDSWVVVDTGSTDGTQALVREVMAGLPGILHERPWVNFAHNRNELLELAAPAADYLLLMDADDVLHVEPGFAWPVLDAPIYSAEFCLGNIAYRRPLLIRRGMGWHYRGAVHEYLHSDRVPPGGGPLLDRLHVVARTAGARSHDPLKYLRDAVLLEEALLADPGDARSMFYLAQSYRDCGQLDNAIDRYTRRVQMGGWSEEVFFSLYQIGRLKGLRGDPWPEVLDALLAAWNHSPRRAEPLHLIAAHYRESRTWALAWHFARTGLQIPLPGADALFVEREVYSWRLSDELAIASYWLQDYRNALELNERLLANPALPAEQRPRIEENRRYCLQALAGRR